MEMMGRSAQKKGRNRHPIPANEARRSVFHHTQLKRCSRASDARVMLMARPNAVPTFEKGISGAIGYQGVGEGAELFPESPLRPRLVRVQPCSHYSPGESFERRR